VDQEKLLTESEAKQVWDEEAAALDPETPAPEVEPEPTPEPDPEPVDPLAGLPTELRDRLDRLEKDNADLRNHVRSAEGRVAAIQREREEQRRQAEVVAPSSVEVAKATANPEKWNQLKQDFPEWAEAMEEYVASRVGQNPQGVSPDQLQNLVQERTEIIRAEAMEAIEYAKLETKHEDWKETINSEAFATWLKVQPIDTYNLINSPKAADAVKVINLFKADAKTPTSTTVADIKNQRKSLLSNAVVTKPGESRPSKTLDSMTPDELWKYEARQREKKNSQQNA
jgi:hypothetical protein